MAPTRATRRPRICLVGAADDTDNLGVSALTWSLVAGLARTSFSPDLTVFDNGRGWREDVATVGPAVLPFHRFGMWPSRRWHRPESLWNMRASARFGGLRNRGARALVDADAVWDISGGDSFGDLYGESRWRLRPEGARPTSWATAGPAATDLRAVPDDGASGAGGSHREGRLGGMGA